MLRRRASLLAGVVALSLVLTACFGSGSNSTARQEVNATLDRLEHAFLTEDLDELKSLMASTVVSSLEFKSGVKVGPAPVDRDELMIQPFPVEMEYVTVTPLKSELTGRQITVNGEAAVAKAAYLFQQRMEIPEEVLKDATSFDTLVETLDLYGALFFGDANIDWEAELSDGRVTFQYTANMEVGLKKIDGKWLLTELHMTNYHAAIIE